MDIPVWEQKMTREEEINDSLEFCRDIARYYKRDDEDFVVHLESSYSNRTTVSGSLSSHYTEEYPTQEENLVHYVLKLVFYVLLAFCVARAFNYFVMQPTKVDGVSMEPGLEDGEYLMMDKLTYRFCEPERFDIIIFPYQENVYYIKRIIGLPEETVQIIDGQVYIDGMLLESDFFGQELIAYAGRAAEKIQLGKGEYFVMGDNRNNSMDSRYEAVGNIAREKILGRAFLRIYPLRTFGFLKSRATSD